MFKTTQIAVAIGIALTLTAPASASYLTFFGQDIQTETGLPLLTPPAPVPDPGDPVRVTTVNSDGARNSFFTKLQAGVGTENFESQIPGTTNPVLTLGTITATLSGGSGAVGSVTPGSTNNGSYSIPSETSSRYWGVTATSDTTNTFTVTFSEAVAAFGFYAIDLGDQGANVEIEILDGNGNVIDARTATGATVSSAMAYTRHVSGAGDSSAFFFGFVAGDTESFTKVRFISRTAGVADTFAFDNFTVALRSQLAGPGGNGDPPTVPEPTSLAIMAAALGALGLSTRRRRKH